MKPSELMTKKGKSVINQHHVTIALSPLAQSTQLNQKPRRQRQNQHTPPLTPTPNENVPTLPHLLPNAPLNIQTLARLKDPTRPKRLSQRTMKRMMTTMTTTMRVRRVTVMMMKMMMVVAITRMKKSRQPMLNCRLISLLKARERYAYC